MSEDRGKRIYDNIRRLTWEKGLTIGAMCNQAHLSQSVVCDLKHGRKDNIGTRAIEKLCSVLECTPNDILYNNNENEPLPEKPKGKRTDKFFAEVESALSERQELRRLVRIAMKANKKQVEATAVLLEEILKGGFPSHEDA